MFKNSSSILKKRIGYWLLLGLNVKIMKENLAKWSRNYTTPRTLEKSGLLLKTMWYSSAGLLS